MECLLNELFIIDLCVQLLLEGFYSSLFYYLLLLYIFIMNCLRDGRQLRTASEMTSPGWGITCWLPSSHQSRVKFTFINSIPIHAFLSSIISNAADVSVDKSVCTSGFGTGSSTADCFGDQLSQAKNNTP